MPGRPGGEQRLYATRNRTGDVRESPGAVSPASESNLPEVVVGESWRWGKYLFRSRRALWLSCARLRWERGSRAPEMSAWPALVRNWKPAVRSRHHGLFGGVLDAKARTKGGSRRTEVRVDRRAG